MWCGCVRVCLRVCVRERTHVCACMRAHVCIHVSVAMCVFVRSRRQLYARVYNYLFVFLTLSRAPYHPAPSLYAKPAIARPRHVGEDL